MFYKSATWAFGIISVIFAFVPDSFFYIIKWIPTEAVQRYLVDKGITDAEIDTIITKIICYAIVWTVVTLIYIVRRTVTIKGNNYVIKVKYGNLLKEVSCKRVINFDECYSLRFSLHDKKSVVSIYIFRCYPFIFLQPFFNQFMETVYCI